MGKVYGYARVSTGEQNTDRQVHAMCAYGVRRDMIYIDKRSGKDFIRPAYRRMIRRLRNGDTLVLKSIDRLGRNYDEILEQWRIICKEKGVDVVVLDMPLLDTTRSKDLLGTFISDLVLQLLSFVSENERRSIRQRQAEGIAAARLRNVRFGRPPIVPPENFGALVTSWRDGRTSMDQLVRECGMSKATIYRKLRDAKIIARFRRDLPPALASRCPSEEDLGGSAPKSPPGGDPLDPTTI